MLYLSPVRKQNNIGPSVEHEAHCKVRRNSVPDYFRIIGLYPLYNVRAGLPNVRLVWNLVHSPVVLDETIHFKYSISLFGKPYFRTDEIKKGSRNNTRREPCKNRNNRISAPL